MSRAESRFKSGVEKEAITSSWLSRGPGPRQARVESSRAESSRGEPSQAESRVGPGIEKPGGFVLRPIWNIGRNISRVDALLMNVVMLSCYDPIFRC